MKFETVAQARRHLWQHLLSELSHLKQLDVLWEEECEDEFDRRRMKTALAQLQKSIQRRLR